MLGGQTGYKIQADMREERVGEDRMAAWFSGSGDIDVRLTQTEREEIESIQESAVKRTWNKMSANPDISETERNVLGAGWRLITRWPSGPSCPHSV